MAAAACPSGGGLQGGQGLGQGLFQGHFGPVGLLPHLAAEVRVQVLQAPEDQGEVPFAAQVFDPQQFQGLGAPGRADFRQGGVFELFDGLNAHRSDSLVQKFW